MECFESLVDKFPIVNKDEDVIPDRVIRRDKRKTKANWERRSRQVDKDGEVHVVPAYRLDDGSRVWEF